MDEIVYLGWTYSPTDFFENNPRPLRHSERSVAESKNLSSAHARDPSAPQTPLGMTVLRTHFHPPWCAPAHMTSTLRIDPVWRRTRIIAVRGRP